MQTIHTQVVNETQCLDTHFNILKDNLGMKFIISLAQKVSTIR